MTRCNSKNRQSYQNLAREWLLRSLKASSVNQVDLQHAAKVYHQLGRIVEAKGDFAESREWYFKSLAISQKLGDPHAAALTYGQVGRLEAIQGHFEDAGRWFGLAITRLQQSGDRHLRRQVIRDFVITYEEAPPDEKGKLQAIWSEAGLGPLPKTA